MVLLDKPCKKPKTVSTYTINVNYIKCVLLKGCQSNRKIVPIRLPASFFHRSPNRPKSRFLPQQMSGHAGKGIHSFVGRKLTNWAIWSSNCGFHKSGLQFWIENLRSPWNVWPNFRETLIYSIEFGSQTRDWANVHSIFELPLAALIHRVPGLYDSNNVWIHGTAYREQGK